ncbi:MAG: cation transporter [bacterium]|nr:cation transporter [bacterium]
MVHTYKITGMTCNSCVSKVQKTLSGIEGVEKAEVTLDPPQAEITMHHHIETKDMDSVLKKVGNYSIEEQASAIHQGNVLESTEETSKLKTYKPLIVVFLYIILGVALLQIRSGELDWMEIMNNFMGGFFLIFSFFKMLDLKNFAFTYSSYDIIAKKWLGYGYVYAFIELSFGILYILKAYPMFTYAATFVVMGISSIGVIQSVMQKRKIQCACLGAVFNLPMTTVTIIEDLLMVLMSLTMLIIMSSSL